MVSVPVSATQHNHRIKLLSRDAGEGMEQSVFDLAWGEPAFETKGKIAK